MTLFSDFGWGSLSDLVFWGSLSLFVCVLLVSSVKISWNYDNLRSICVNILLCCLGFWCGYGAGNCLFFQLIDFLCISPWHFFKHIFLLFSVFFNLRFKTMCEFVAFFFFFFTWIYSSAYPLIADSLNSLFIICAYWMLIFLWEWCIINIYTGCISILWTYPDLSNWSLESNVAQYAMLVILL